MGRMRAFGLVASGGHNMELSSQGSESASWKQRFHDAVGLCSSLYWQDDRDAFFKGIAERVHAMTGADVVNIRLLSSTQDSFIVYATSGDINPALISQYNVLSTTTGRMPHLMRSLKPIVFDFSNPQLCDVQWERGACDGFQTAVTIPLANKGKVEGVCDLLYRRDCAWDAESLDWVEGLGQLIGAVISNALLSEAQISMRLADDRRRLSSEIHDNISQYVNLVAFEAKSMEGSLEEHDEAHLRSQIARLVKASDQAVKILRSEMTQLYDDSADAGVTIDDLEAYARDFAGQWGLSFEFGFAGDRRDVRISRRVSMQLLRIVNEAFANIIRHSGATSMRLDVLEDQESVSLKVSDNGCGFDVAAAMPASMGIRIMQERARTVGGDIRIVSREGHGTQVNVFLPHLS